MIKKDSKLKAAKGCLGCMRLCQFNRPITNPDADTSKHFKCNNDDPEYSSLRNLTQEVIKQVLAEGWRIW